MITPLFVVARYHCRLSMPDNALDMRRLLRRSLGSAGGAKSGGGGSRMERSVAIEVSVQADAGGVPGTNTKRPPPVPESDGVCDDEQTVIERSETLLTQRLDQQSDSGCELGVDTTDVRGPWRLKVLKRQDEINMSRRTSSAISPSSSLERFRRRRASIRSFRVRSEQFLRRRIRPSCLRRGYDSDDTYGPAWRPIADNDMTAVGGWLAVPQVVSEVDGCEQRPPVDAVVPPRTRESSRSDVTTLLSSGDASVWNDRGSSLDSSTSATFRGLSDFQV